MKKLMFIAAFVLLASKTGTAQPFNGKEGVYTREQASILVSTNPAAATAGTVTLSTTAPSAFSTGEFIYVTGAYVQFFSSGSSTGVTTATECTTTNLGSNNLRIGFTTSVSSGSIAQQDLTFNAPIKSTSSAAVTMTCPATPSIRWNMWLRYYQAP